ncbi:MAG: hypothetical protein ABIA11_02025 [Patescibacteria group bacterium]
MNRKYFMYGFTTILILVAAGIVYAAFSDKGKVLGSSFSVANSDIKIMADTTQGTNPANLVDEIAGPSFDNIGQTWQQDYAIKLVNGGTTKLQVMSNAYYETANDPENIREHIYVEIFEWSDANNDGIADPGEYPNSLGKKTIIKWKTEGIALGEFNPGQSKPLVIRFSTENLSETKQGATALFDFIFEGIEM